MPPVGFEPTISAGERLQTYAFDQVATGIGVILNVPAPDEDKSNDPKNWNRFNLRLYR